MWGASRHLPSSRTVVLRILLLIVFLALMVFTLRSGKQAACATSTPRPSQYSSRSYLKKHSGIIGSVPMEPFLSLPSRAAKKRMVINPDFCTNCGRCQRVCPSGAIMKEKRNIASSNSECLVCHECERGVHQRCYQLQVKHVQIHEN